MSRAKVKSRHCNNCGYNFRVEAGHDNYCPNCGQENHNPRRPLLHHLEEFIESWLHFDGKTYTTIRTLVFHPGKVTKDYLHNVRQRYTPPNRLFIFTLVLFILSLEAAQDMMVKRDTHALNNASLGELMERGTDSTRIAFSEPFFSGGKIYYNVAQLKELRDLNADNIKQWLNRQGMKSWLVYRLEARMVKHNIESPLSVMEFNRHIVRVHYEVLLLMVPISALLIFLFFYRSDRFFYDALVTSVHLYVFGLVMGIAMSIGAFFLIRIGVLKDTTIVLPTVMLLSLILNFIPVYKKVYDLKWSAAIVRGVAVGCVNMCVQILLFWVIAGLVG